MRPACDRGRQDRADERGRRAGGPARSTARASRPASRRSRRSCPTWARWDAAHRPDCRFVARIARPGRRLDGARAVLGAARLRGRRLGERLRRRPRPAGAASARRCSTRLLPASEAAGIWTLMAGHPDRERRRASPCTSGRLPADRRPASASAATATGRWRDVVLLERRSTAVGREPGHLNVAGPARPS